MGQSISYPSNVIKFQDPTTGSFLEVDDYGNVTALATQNLTTYSTFLSPGTNEPNVLISASSLWLGNGTSANAPSFLSSTGWTNNIKSSLNVTLGPTSDPTKVTILVNGKSFLHPSPVVNGSGTGVPLPSLLLAAPYTWQLVAGASAFILRYGTTTQYVCSNPSQTAFVLGSQASAQVFESVNRMVFLSGSYKTNAASKSVQAQWLGTSPIGYTHVSSSLQQNSSYAAAVLPVNTSVGLDTNDIGNADTYFLGPALPQPNVGDYLQTDGSNGVYLTGITPEGAMNFTSTGGNIGTKVPGFVITAAPLKTTPLTRAFQSVVAPFAMPAWELGVIIASSVVLVLFFIALGVGLYFRDKKKKGLISKKSAKTKK